MVQIPKKFSFLQNRRIGKEENSFFFAGVTEGIERGEQKENKQENKCIEKQEGLALLIRRVSDEK